MMDEATAAALKDFVSNGGTLVAAAPFAEMDRWGKRQGNVPAFGLDEVFGCTSDAAPGNGKQITVPQGTIEAGDPEHLTLKGAATIAGTFPDGAPAITSNAFGKGHAILIAGKIGRPFIDWAKADALPALLADVLKQASVVSVTGVKKGSGSPVDVSALADARGNVLVVSSIASNNAKAPTPVEGATITYRGADPASFHGGFAFPATTSDGTTVLSGPVPVTLTPNTEDGSVSFPLDKIDSAMPVLLTKDAAPLVAVQAPASVTSGSNEDITVTCYNPSAQPVQGQLGAQAGGSEATLDAGATPVSIPAYGQQQVVLKAKVTALLPVARVPVTVLFTPAGGAAIKAVPVDIAVK
jgi:hypothetical protein